jgi:hypothetical protein
LTNAIRAADVRWQVEGRRVFGADGQALSARCEPIGS